MAFTGDQLRDLLREHYYTSAKLGFLKKVRVKPFPKGICALEQLIQEPHNNERDITKEVVEIMEARAARHVHSDSHPFRAGRKDHNHPDRNQEKLSNVAFREIAKAVAAGSPAYDPDNLYRYRALDATGQINKDLVRFVGQQLISPGFGDRNKNKLVVNQEGVLFFVENIKGSDGNLSSALPGYFNEEERSMLFSSLSMTCTACFVVY